MPVLISLDALVQLLAVGYAGPELSPAEFGPLMTSILGYQLGPPPDAYTAEDLAWLLDIEERCADLPPDRVERIAAVVSHARMAGKPANDSSLRLEVQRAFQADKMALTSDRDTAKLELAKKSEEADRQREKSVRAEGALVTERRERLLSNAKSQVAKETIVWVLVGAAWTALTYAVARLALPKSGFWNVASYVVSAGGPLATVVGIVTGALPDYRKRKASAEDDARRQVLAELSEGRH